MPDDGTGSLPLLRHIIVNDDKSSSYKLGLLRVLTRIAESAPGIVANRTDDYVDVPLGIVGLYWLKQYKPLLLTHKIAQHPNSRQGYGFAGDDFYKLDKISNYDLRVGASFDAERGAIVTGAIRDACKNITAMPARYITYPGQNRPVFEYERSTVRISRKPITLSKVVPARLWYLPHTGTTVANPGPVRLLAGTGHTARVGWPDTGLGHCRLQSNRYAGVRLGRGQARYQHCRQPRHCTAAVRASPFPACGLPEKSQRRISTTASPGPGG